MRNEGSEKWCYEAVGVQGIVNWLPGIVMVSEAGVQGTRSRLVGATIRFVICAVGPYLGIRSMASAVDLWLRWLIWSSVVALCAYGGGMLTV